MSKRNLALVLSVILVVMLAMWLWLSIRSSSRVQRTPIMTQSSIAQPTSPQADITPETTTGRQLPGGPPEPSDPRWKKRETKRRIDPQYEWKMPINFFGRVVDEKGQPVPRATIVAQWSDLSPRGATDETFLSDDQGFFSMTEKTGRGITIRVSKDGYYTPKQQQI